MTNELVEAENHYFVLSDILLKKVVQKHPKSLQETKRLIDRLEGFNVYEKTYYVAELLEAVEDPKPSNQLDEIQNVLSKNGINNSVISLLQQYNTWIK